MLLFNWKKSHVHLEINFLNFVELFYMILRSTHKSQTANDNGAKSDRKNTAEPVKQHHRPGEGENPRYITSRRSKGRTSDDIRKPMRVQRYRQSE